MAESANVEREAHGERRVGRVVAGERCDLACGAEPVAADRPDDVLRAPERCVQ